MRMLQGMHGKSIQKPLGEKTPLPQRLSPEEIPDLIIRLRAGDVIAEKRLIEGLMRLTTYVVSKYNTIQWTDDLLGTAYLAVVKAVRRAKIALVDNNIEAFVMRRVRGDLYHLFEKEKYYREIDKHSLVKKVRGRIENKVEVDEVIQKFYLTTNWLEKTIFDKFFYERRTRVEVAKELSYTTRQIDRIREKIREKFLKLGVTNVVHARSKKEDRTV